MLQPTLQSILEGESHSRVIAPDDVLSDLGLVGPSDVEGELFGLADELRIEAFAFELNLLMGVRDLLVEAGTSLALQKGHQLAWLIEESWFVTGMTIQSFSSFLQFFGKSAFVGVPAEGVGCI